jgi:hypothetical protein
MTSTPTEWQRLMKVRERQFRMAEIRVFIVHLLRLGVLEIAGFIELMENR